MSNAIPQGWRRRSLSDLGAYENGFAFNDQHWSEFGLPIVRIAQITGSQGIVDRYPGRLPDTFRIDTGDLIFSWSGTLAVVRWTGGPAWLNQHLFKVVPDASVDEALLFHLLQASVAEMSKRTHGSTMKHIKRGELREFFVNLPVERDEQRKLAHVLDTLDTAIFETEAIIAKLKAVKQGLLHDLLTRGIDANGELRPPQDEAPHLYKDSPLGGIPKDWSLMKLGQILSEPTKNGLYKSSQFHGRGPLMVQMGGLFSGDAVTFDTATRVSVTPFEFNNFGLVEGDLLFARRSLVFEGAGQCVIVRNLPEPATFESSIVRVRVRSNEAEPEFVCQYLRSYKSYIQRRTLIRQVAVSGVSSADIRELLVALPSPEEQRVHVARQLEVQTRIDLETMSVEKLRSQKSGLMDDLLTGRVRVTPLLNTNNEQGAS